METKDLYFDEASSKPRRRSLRLTSIFAIVTAAFVTISLTAGMAAEQMRAKSRTRISSEGQHMITAFARSVQPAANANNTIWQPGARATWQIVLRHPLELSPNAPAIEPDVDIFDIDLFDNPASTIDALHKLGKKVVCYFSAGSYEPYRSDSSQFRESDLGEPLDGWPDEKWLDLNSPNVRRIMADRIALARKKGCDAIDPDNIDSYNNDNGLDLEAYDSIKFIRFLSQEALANGLSIGLKNAAEIVSDIEADVQFSVVEECTEYEECGNFAPFIHANKPVFQIEYPSKSGAATVSPNMISHICGNKDDASGSDGFSTILKDYSLDGWAQYCDGDAVRTAITKR
ncbi:hypothetical protein D0869_05059 [Hortaea werneckii]|uniref:alpha-galactosidase n=2 Tax=Hortaea werneckii TaxID=91943 RepID=A0A3M7ANF3_HORWE|nr:hypothetical protein KC334_g2024 [Hortaea werneckii]KAI6995223.1 hypothetical protein KC355_g10244 [Hortaea werneckii]KAI7181271.1 hypothetical protein KC324_g8725 [Hortaea werneckii]KAI7580778.1 hypothetical protein KC316_g8805 [Hortaea werneckii]KAI7656068.1 hypothetical protein KC318_g12648 [Hortaea werneckii]